MSAATAMHRLVTEAHRPDAILFGKMARYIICDELVDGLLHALDSQRLRVVAWLKNDSSFTGPVVTFARVPTHLLHDAGNQVAGRVEPCVQHADLRRYFNQRIADGDFLVGDVNHLVALVNHALDSYASDSPLV